MTIYLYGIGSIKSSDAPITEALAQPGGTKFGMIIANPLPRPRDKKGDYTSVGDDGRITCECPGALAQQGRDKANLNVFWLKDESLEDTENILPPAEFAGEIVENLESALEEFRGEINN